MAVLGDKAVPVGMAVPADTAVSVDKDKIHLQIYPDSILAYLHFPGYFRKTGIFDYGPLFLTDIWSRSIIQRTIALYT